MIVVDFRATTIDVGDAVILYFSIDDGNSASGSDVFTVGDGQAVRISFETLGAMLGVNLEDFVGSELRIEEDTGYVCYVYIPASGDIYAELA